MIFSWRERECPLVTEHLVFDGIEALFVNGIGDGFLLREDELVLGAENADTDFHGVGIVSVLLFRHGEVAGTMESQSIVKASESAGIASGKSNNIEIPALQDETGGNRFAVGSAPHDIIPVRGHIGQVLDAVQQN